MFLPRYTFSRYLWKHSDDVTRSEMWTNILLVQNGFGLYQTWTAIASSLNLGFALRHMKNPLSLDTVCWIVLAALATVYIVYIIIDIVAGVKLRYQLAPYFVIVWGIAGIVTRNYDPNASYTKAVKVSLVVAILVLFAKIAAVFTLAKKYPSKLEIE